MRSWRVDMLKKSIVWTRTYRGNFLRNWTWLLAIINGIFKGSTVLKLSSYYFHCTSSPGLTSWSVWRWFSNLTCKKGTTRSCQISTSSTKGVGCTSIWPKGQSWCKFPEPHNRWRNGWYEWNGGCWLGYPGWSKRWGYFRSGEQSTEHLLFEPCFSPVSHIKQKNEWPITWKFVQQEA